MALNQVSILKKLLKNADLIIDFTVPKCTFEVLKIASN